MFVRYNEAGQHPITLEDRYAEISPIKVSDGPPETIRDEFDTVRNLYLYSWYVYDFTVPAILYAHALIEKAIKEKCDISGVSRKEHKGLRKLLELAIDQGWLTNAAFPFALEQTRAEIVSNAIDPEPTMFRTTPRYLPDDTDYCMLLAKLLPKIRNMGAHGDTSLSFPATALREIQVCACIINALFPSVE